MSNPSSSPSILWPVHPAWQLDPAHPIPETERRLSCAVATVKMLLDHCLPEQGHALPFHQVRDGLLRAGGKDAHGHWRHSAQVGFLSTLGLVAWRRNWNALSQNPDWLAAHEGYSPAQLAAIRTQTAGEQEIVPEERPWQSLLTALFTIGPVIASVRPGFTTNAQNHQILLHGYRVEGATELVAFVDPLIDPQTSPAPSETDLPRFRSYFNRWAIFAQPSDGSARQASTMNSEFRKTSG